MALALPLLDSMIPAQTPLSKTAAAPKLRFTGIFVPHGMAPGYWIPDGPVLQADKLPTIMEPLAPFVDRTTILSGMWTKSAEPPPGVTGADHWVAAAYLCANKPKKTTGSDIEDGTTIDQLIAQKIGQETLLPSLQLAIEDPGANSSNCGEGYSCAYTNSISWSSPNRPLPMELNPQVVFERLFGDVQAKTPQERAERREQDRSILDAVTKKLATFKKDLGAADKTKVDDYTDSIREIERRLEIAKKATGAGQQRRHRGARPACRIPSTNISSCSSTCRRWPSRRTSRAFRRVLYARDLTGRSFPASGTTTSFHGGSHHAENPDRIKDYSKINRYHVQCLAYYLDKLKSTPDGDGTLLDHSLVLYGTNMGDSNQHLHYDVPHILAGGAAGQLKGGRHLNFPTKTITTGNLLLSILSLYGVHQESIGDSTGMLPGLV